MNQCVALIIEKAPTLQKRNFGAKIQNGYKILSIDTYYKGKLAYPHFNKHRKQIKLHPISWQYPLEQVSDMVGDGHQSQVPVTN